MNINVKMVLTSLVGKVPLYIEGRPGTGKTATIQAVAQWLDRPLVTIIGATRDRTDFGGWPRYSEKEDRVRVYPFPWVEELVRAGERGILFLDEINASEEIFPVLLRVIAERVIGDVRFEGDVIAAGNPEELSVAGLTLPAPVANRVLHYHWKTLPEEWADGMVLGFASVMGSPPPIPSRETVEAETAAVRVLAASYIRRNPHALDDPPKGRTNVPYPSPRTWDLLARFLGAARALGMDEEVMALGAWGAIGERGYEFLNFLKAQDLPSPEELLEKPELLPSREDSAFVALLGVVQHVGYHLAGERFDPSKWEKAWNLLAWVSKKGLKDVAGYPAILLARTYQALPQERKMQLPFPEGAEEFIKILGKARLVLFG